MPVVTPDDIAAVAGRPVSDSDERLQVTQWISDVEMLIAARLGDLTALNQDLLRYVVRETVVARMRYREDRNSQRSGPSANEVDTGDENYFLRVLNPWWLLLGGPSGSNVGAGAFSARPYFETDRLPPESWI